MNAHLSPVGAKTKAQLKNAARQQQQQQQQQQEVDVATAAACGLRPAAPFPTNRMLKTLSTRHATPHLGGFSC